MPAARPSLESELEALAPLAEPVRRRLYLFVAESLAPVGRDEAAAALSISRPLAAFHLDRLVADGLLDTEFLRRSGRTGPGAGRPAKLYRRSRTSHEVNLPARNYELAASLFAEALAGGEARGGEPAAEDGGRNDKLEAEARAYGRAVGRTIRRRHIETPADRSVDDALHIGLAAEGYEPRDDKGVIRLGNCPFHALAKSHRDLTCGMNLALMSGLVEGVGAAEEWHAVLDPRPGLCCVAFEPTRSSEETTRVESAAGRVDVPELVQEVI